MSALTDVLKVIGMVIAVIVVVPAALAISAYVGFFFGIILLWLAAPALVGLGVTSGTIPQIVAWLFVAGAIFGMGARGGGKAE